MLVKIKSYLQDEGLAFKGLFWPTCVVSTWNSEKKEFKKYIVVRFLCISFQKAYFEDAIINLCMSAPLLENQLYYLMSSLISMSSFPF